MTTPHTIYLQITDHDGDPISPPIDMTWSDDRINADDVEYVRADGIRAVYEQHKHLDNLLSDTNWLPNTPQGFILGNLWRIIVCAVCDDPTDCISCSRNPGISGIPDAPNYPED